MRKLAEEIGERHVFRPQSLANARDYIRSRWEAEGYVVEAQTYEVMDVPCSNLSITLPGTRFPGQVVLMGAHYDTVRGSPVRTTTPAALLRCWNWAVASTSADPAARSAWWLLLMRRHRFTGEKWVV